MGFSKLLSLIYNIALTAFKLSRKISSGNALREEENQKPWTTFNLGLELTAFRTTGPRSASCTLSNPFFFSLASGCR